jgi:hypothetical protein
MSDDKAESTSKILSMDEYLEADDVEYVTVPLPDGKGSLRFGSLDAGSMLDFIDSNDGPAKRTAGLRLIIQSLVDDKGVRIGSDKHLNGLKKKNAAFTNRLVGEILKLNGMGEAAKKVLGNASSEAPTDASPSV